MHHIDPKGQDSGVVYSEMQGRENTSGDLIAIRFVDIFFFKRPPALHARRSQRLLDLPGSAYRSETGGLMEALRVLTVEKSEHYFCKLLSRSEDKSSPVSQHVLCPTQLITDCCGQNLQWYIGSFVRYTGSSRAQPYCARTQFRPTASGLETTLRRNTERHPPAHPKNYQGYYRVS